MLGLACANAALLLTTLLWKNWIEVVSGDPDHGHGGAEWLIVGPSSAAAVVFSVGAQAEWRQLQSTSA
jgi:hypothetical protein